MMRSSWDHRRKQEARSLIDLTKTVGEKYGRNQGFLIELRVKEGQKKAIKYKEPMSSKWNDADFGALIVDDRQKKVELIREENLNIDEKESLQNEYDQGNDYKINSLLQKNRKYIPSLNVSKSASEIRTDSYSIDKDPLVRQRINRMLQNTINFNKHYHKKVEQHISTTSSNKDLLKLRIDGTNVYESEKAQTSALIEKLKGAGKKGYS